jgi:hypothetical protein
MYIDPFNRKSASDGIYCQAVHIIKLLLSAFMTHQKYLELTCVSNRRVCAIMNKKIKRP